MNTIDDVLISLKLLNKYFIIKMGIYLLKMKGQKDNSNASVWKFDFL